MIIISGFPITTGFGFSLLYPADVLGLERTSAQGDGAIFVGQRGHGRLLIGVLENRDGHNVASYQDFVRRKSYTKFEVQYAPRRQSWFVLSGESDREVFYEKVMFSCAGRYISSFAFVYPIESKWLFDPIVERMENTFRPARYC
jgi:hypothetical protein